MPIGKAESPRLLPALGLVAAVGLAVFVLSAEVGVVARAVVRAREAVPLDALGLALASMCATAALLVARRWRVLVREVAARRAAEARLVAACEAAEALARLRSSFLASVSHEVRTPLAGIIGFATVLAEELPADKREIAQLIRQSGERVVETLNSILDLTRLEAGAVAVRLEPCDVAAEAVETARLFQRLAEDKGLFLRVEAPPGPVPALLDATFLHRILNNLLSNAVKFTAAGGITVRVTQGDGQVTLAVQDTGIGIGEAVLPHIFDEYVQEDAGLPRTHFGSGLGLAITHHLVELMDGAITVESRKGEGSTFTLVFPASPALPEGHGPGSPVEASHDA